MPPARPLATLPDLSSAAVNSAAAEAFSVNVAGPERMPASSMAYIVTIPGSAAPLMIRSIPSGPPDVPAATSSGAV